MKSGISFIAVGLVALLNFSSCIKKDNYDGPDASLEGGVYIEGTAKGQKVQTCTGNFSIRLEQLDWSETPAPQGIPIKHDGTYKNSKLFSGHYRISIFGGAFWPTIPEEIDIANGSKHDFQVLPYVFVNNITSELIGDSLKLKVNIEAPLDGIPDIAEIQPFVNTTSIVGPGASINQYSTVGRIRPETPYQWASMTPEQKSPEIMIPNMLRGRTFYVRVGVTFNDAQRNSNLSEVIRVDIPE